MGSLLLIYSWFQGWFVVSAFKHSLFLWMCVCTCVVGCIYINNHKKNHMTPSNTFDKICCIQMSQCYLQPGVLPPVSCEIRVIFLKNFFTWTQLCSHGSCSRKTLVSLSGHQQKALDCWRGGLTVQRRACTGRSEEWLELWWAKKCSLVRFQKRWEGTKGKVRAGLGEGDSAWWGIQRKANSQSGWFQSKWVF